MQSTTRESGSDGVKRVSIQLERQSSSGKEVTISDDKPRGSVVEEREGWGNKIEFILAIVGYAVGLGNVWRFPYLAQKNGGGAFLIPYIISLVFMGIPLFFLELAIGQRKRKGPLHIWNNMYKPLAGMGIAAVVASFLVGIYYNMIVAWCFYYFFISFQKNVPYSSCPITGYEESNTTGRIPVYLPECLLASKTTYYYYRVALQATDSIEVSGGLNWQLALCLLLSWVIIFAITCKGVESMGKAVYFTAIFPYIVLIIFFVRTMMLEGAGAGIKHMFSPDFAKLQKAETWLEASTQIFYSLGLSFGGLISMASYNDINNNVIRDALLVSSVNCGTSIFAGIVIFGILGYKATINYKNCLADQIITRNMTSSTSFSSVSRYGQQMLSNAANANATTMLSVGNDTTVCDLNDFLNNVASGPGLTFIAFTEAMSTMEVTQIWSVLFFMMLLTLGIGSMLGTFEAVRTSVVDLQILPVRMEFVSLILCAISFLFGLLFCQKSGEYWLQMFDTYSANMGLLVLGLFEFIIVAYIYGYDKLEKDVEFMLKKKLNLYWKLNIKYISPSLTLLIIFATIYGLISDGMDYEAYNPDLGRAVETSYPTWAVVICVLLMLSSIIFIPLIAILVKLDKFNLPGFKEEIKHEVRRRSSVIPMHPDQHRRESAALKRRISKIDLDIIREEQVTEVDSEEEENAAKEV